MANPIIYQISNGNSVQPATGSGQTTGAKLTTGLQNTTTNAHLGLLESIDKSVKDAVKGTEALHGSGGLGTSAAGSGLGVVAGAIAKFDDVTAIGNNLQAGRFLEASMEAAGALAGPVGGGAAGLAINSLTTILELHPGFGRVLTGAGIFLGDKYAGDLAKEAAYGEWVQSTAPVIPADAGLAPSQTINGVNYYVVSSPDQNGTPRTYVYTDSGNSTGSDPLLFPNQPRYLPVVDQDISKQVVSDVLIGVGFDPKISLQQYNVMQGVSPSGYPIDSVNYAATGTTTISGTDSNAIRREPVTQVSTFKDPQTGAIMEVRTQGVLVNGEFQATPNSTSTAGMDTTGRLVLTGDEAISILRGKVNPASYPDGETSITKTDNTDNTTPLLSPVEVKHASISTSVSIQNHGNGQQSFEFTHSDGGHTFIMENTETGGRTVVVVEPKNSDAPAQTTVYELDKNGYQTSPARNFDKSGQEVDATGKVIENSQTTPAATTSDGGYMGADGVYRLFINGTSTSVGSAPSVPADSTKATTDKISFAADSDENLDDTPAFTPIAATKDLPPGQVITLAAADADDDIVTDAGSGGYVDDSENSSNTETNTPVAGVPIASSATNNVANPADSVAPTTPVTISTLNPWQNQTVNDALTASGLNLDANNPITALPPVGGMAILANSEGDIVGTIDTSAANTTGFTTVSLLGQPVKMVDALGFSHDPADVAAANNAAGALGLVNTLIGLENWDNASDFSRVQTAVTLYNQVNNLAGLGMPNMGGLGAGLGFIGAVQNGDFGGMVVGAIGVGNAIGSAMDMGAMAVSEAIGAALGMSAVNVIPGLNLIFALTNIEENVQKDNIYYLFNSTLGNKYAGYSLKIPSKPAYLLKTAENDDLFTLTA